jgi:hypothetical protein
MNTGQMLLAIGALILLGTTVLSVNSSTLNQGTILRQTELGIYAVSLATSYMQKARGMDFDEFTVGGLPLARTPTPGGGVLSATLGRDGTTEVSSFDNTFDDFDDYNRFVKDTAIASVDSFHISSVVFYVGQAPPYAPDAGPTWLKQMDIAVNGSISRSVFENPGTNGGIDTVKMSYIYSYFQ